MPVPPKRFYFETALIFSFVNVLLKKQFLFQGCHLAVKGGFLWLIKKLATIIQCVLPVPVLEKIRIIPSALNATEPVKSSAPAQCPLALKAVVCATRAHDWE